MFDGDGGMRGCGPLTNGMTEGVDGGDCVLVDPLEVSITNGINSTPTKRQADSWEVSLRLVPTLRAWP